MKILPRETVRQHLQNRLKPSSILSFLSILALSTTVTAADFTVTGESSTILRMRDTVDNRNLFPAYEYLKLNTYGKLSDGSTVGIYFGGWGRVDLGDKSTDKYSETDLQYFFASYRLPKNNFVANVGRQFVTEGVAAEKIDGIYVRGDLLGGVSAAAFFGESVNTEPNFSGGNTIYGSRISLSNPAVYSIGISALKNEASHNSSYREEEGIDIWLHPIKNIDLIGRSSYNSITNDWMEHAYKLSSTQIKDLSISASVNSINYNDYYFNMTTRALSLGTGFIKPGESLLSLGANASYTVIKELAVTADYKNYNYDIAGNANYYGMGCKYSSPETVTAGVSMHRMDGASDNLRYLETRVYALKKLGTVDISADFLNLYYDKKIQGVQSSSSLSGSLGYEFNKQLKMVTNLEFSRSPDFDRETKAMVKLNYLFETKINQGRNQSEK